ncbi:MAG: ABC transporter ATP-binding protein [Lachnospiraceae bacterium]|nr:ABC transporter ATP-binding protein [Lachnospiraceae bacterium]
MKKLLCYMANFKFHLLLAFVLAVTGNLLALVGPSLSGKAVDAIAPGKGAVDFDTVWYYAGFMVLFYIGSAVLSYCLSLLMLHIAQRLAARMRQQVFDRLLSLPVGYFDQNQAGDIISRVSYDIDVIATSVSNDFVQVVAGFVTVVGSFAMMLAISPKLVIVVFLMIPLSVFYTRFMAKRTRPMFRKRSAKAGELNGMVEELITGQKTIQAYAKEKVMTERFDTKNEEAVCAYYNAEYYGSMIGPTVNFINNCSLTVVTVAGSVLYLLKQLTLGDISSFVLYSRKFSGPINELANVISEIQSALSAAERVFRVLEEPTEAEDVYGAVTLERVKGNVSMEKVDFSYVPEKPVIKNWSMQVKAGELVAIVGPTGAGKTTIINLLMRFYDPQKGEIRVDGHENREITMKSLRASYAMVLQDTWVFEGTVHENIAYGRDGASREEVIAAAKAAGVHEFVKRLPEGYDTVITEDGVNLSKGQKQLLTIARAMLSDAKMLILDEATSNVDTRTELRIRDAMLRLMEGKTCFVIAHRLSTIQNADNIIVVNNGTIEESGTHEELMHKRGFYYKLYASQFQ